MANFSTTLLQLPFAFLQDNLYNSKCLLADEHLDSRTLSSSSSIRKLGKGSEATRPQMHELHLVDERLIVTPAHRTDRVDVRAVWVHVNVRHHKVEGRANAQQSIQVSKVVLQVRVPWQRNLLL